MKTFSCSSEIITVGDELLRGVIVNSNAEFLGRELADAGLPARRTVVVGDDVLEIESAISEALTRAVVVVVTGGLGPTPDDVTRDAVAELFQMPLREDPELVVHVHALFRARGMIMPPASRNQTMFPTGARKIPNAHGTAAGIHVERADRHVFVLPGVSVEMQQMMRDYVLPHVRLTFPRVAVPCRTLRLAGIGESHLLELLGDQDDLRTDATLAYLPHHGLLDVRLTARSADPHEAAAQIARVESRFRDCVHDHIYATARTTLPEVIGNVLVNRGQLLAVAESCTGGLVATMLTDTPGSSRWFERGWVTYSNAAKIETLDVSADVIEQDGAVSESVARAMAEGARRQAKVHWALSATGIAGPDGGSSDKPVGTVWVAVASEKETTARLLQLGGLRETIKLRTAHSVLFMLFRRLMDAS